MDARTQRRVKRETVREVDYAEFVKENTHKKISSLGKRECYGGEFLGMNI